MENGYDTSVDELIKAMKADENHFDLTIIDTTGDSLVGIAAKRDDFDTLKILLEHGAPADKANIYTGITPIIHAKVNKNKTMEDYLAEHRANPSQHSSDDYKTSLTMK